MICYYRVLINVQINHHKSRSIYPEISPMKKFLIYLNINTKKPLETLDAPMPN